MELFLLGTLATFAAWVLVRCVLPFAVPGRFSPFVVTGMSFGVLHLPWQWIVTLSCSTGVALLCTLTGELPEPWKPRFSIKRPTLRRRGQEDITRPVGYRPGSLRGRRIPRL